MHGVEPRYGRNAIGMKIVNARGRELVQASEGAVRIAKGPTMRTLVILVVSMALVASIAAQDLGNQAPVKPVVTYPENIPNPERQGGDTIALAHVIPSLPWYSDSGTTAGYNDDYDEVCPYTGATAPDVVYKYVATSYVAVNIDLCGSSFDTKLYVYNAALALIACNDDFYFGAPCGVYVSKLENVNFNAGTTYYIVVDGYGAASGSYVLTVPTSPRATSSSRPVASTRANPRWSPNTSTTGTVAATLRASRSRPSETRPPFSA